MVLDTKLTEINMQVWNEPEIEYKILPCAGCGAPHGSPCQPIEKTDMDIFENNDREKICKFAGETTVVFYTNYWISVPLINKIGFVPGVSWILPMDNYKFSIKIAKMFDVKKVIKNTIYTYKTFIKSLNAINTSHLPN